MIVNPQFFNYKLIIGALIITIASLSAGGYAAYEKYRSEHYFLTQEKKLIETELSEMIARYDSLSKKDALLTDQLNNTDKNSRKAEHEIMTLKHVAAAADQYKKRMGVYEATVARLFSTIDSLSQSKPTLKDPAPTPPLLDEKKNLNSHRSHPQPFQDGNGSNG